MNTEANHGTVKIAYDAEVLAMQANAPMITRWTLWVEPMLEPGKYVDLLYVFDLQGARVQKSLGPSLPGTTITVEDGVLLISGPLCVGNGIDGDSVTATGENDFASHFDKLEHALSAMSKPGTETVLCNPRVLMYTCAISGRLGGVDMRSVLARWQTSSVWQNLPKSWMHASDVVVLDNQINIETTTCDDTQSYQVSIRWDSGRSTDPMSPVIHLEVTHGCEYKYYWRSVRLGIDRVLDLVKPLCDAILQAICDEGEWQYIAVQGAR